MIYLNGTETTLTENTAVVSTSGRLIHVQTPDSRWLCGKTPSNNVEVVTNEQSTWLKTCPKCQKAR